MSQKQGVGQETGCKCESWMNKLDLGMRVQEYVKGQPANGIKVQTKNLEINTRPWQKDRSLILSQDFLNQGMYQLPIAAVKITIYLVA